MNFYFSEEYQEKRNQINQLIFADYDLNTPEKTTVLKDGYIIKHYYFEDKANQKSGYSPIEAELCKLYKNDNLIFEWTNTDGKTRMAKIINHSNGKKYLIFDEDLYGYSVLDIETGFCVHYFPEESFFRDLQTFKETFIWCEPHYDIKSNLLAIDGCYWACPYSVIVVDFTNPVNIIETSDWYDLIDYIEDDDVICNGFEFREWSSDALICSSLTIKKQDILTVLNTNNGGCLGN